MKKLFIASLTLLTTNLFAGEALWCRTPLKITMGGAYIQLEFARNAQPSGDQGQNVQPGSCAFLDRGVSNSESTILTIPHQSGQGTLSNTSFAVMVDRVSENNFLQSALLAPNTLIQFMVKNNGASFESTTGVMGAGFYVIIPNAPVPAVPMTRIRLPNITPRL